MQDVKKSFDDFIGELNSRPSREYLKVYNQFRNKLEGLDQEDEIVELYCLLENMSYRNGIRSGAQLATNLINLPELERGVYNEN